MPSSSLLDLFTTSTPSNHFVFKFSQCCASVQKHTADQPLQQGLEDCWNDLILGVIAFGNLVPITILLYRHIIQKKRTA